MPSGEIMLEYSISGLSCGSKKALFVGLLEKHIGITGLDIEALNKKLGLKFKPKTLSMSEDNTDSHAKTVASILKTIKKNKGIFLKDVDNYFTINLDECFEEDVGYICVVPSCNFSGNLKNKSGVEIDEHGFVKGISENSGHKNEFLCVGGYAFPSLNSYLGSFERITNHNDANVPELKVSDVINDLINSGAKFKTKVVENYIDFGTYEDWANFKEKFATLFIDFDGVLVENGSEFFNNKWELSKPIIENIKAIQNEYYYVVITSSRPEKMRSVVIEQLEKFGIKYDQVVLGLPSCKRIVINDKANNNATNTAFSINTKRNDTSLSRLIKKITTIKGQ